MIRNETYSRILLLKDRRAPFAAGQAPVQRYRLMRARLDGRATPAQRSASDSARSSRSASLFIP
jgi:hypothetical protein